MSSTDYRNNENTPEHPEELLSEIIAAVDDADMQLCMNYGRYVERPSQQRMREIIQATDVLFDAFGALIYKTVHDTTLPLDENVPQEEKASILATTLHDLTEKHAELLADYTDDIVLATPHESEDSLTSLTEILQDDAEESLDNLIGAALARLKGLCESDIEVIEIITARKVWLRSELAKRSLHSVGKIAQIGIGAAIGITIAEKMRRR